MKDNVTEADMISFYLGFDHGYADEMADTWREISAPKPSHATDTYPGESEYWRGNAAGRVVAKIEKELDNPLID